MTIYDQLDDAEGPRPCPDGDPQRECELIGFRLKAPDLLQLRLALRPDDNGICEVLLDEQPDCVRVRAFACINLRSRRRRFDGGSTEMDCPLRVWLSEPLADRPVLDQASGEELWLMLPMRTGGRAESRYVPRPPGPVWPPDLVDALFPYEPTP
jgi:hypothetical protein